MLTFRPKMVVRLLSLAGVVLILVASSRLGVGMDEDSAKYLSSGENLAAGKGPERYDGRPLVEHCPS